MRKILITSLVMLIAGNVFAIERRPIARADLKNGEPHLGWYLSPVIKFGDVADDSRVFGGIRGGLTVNSSFFIGGAIYGSPEDDEYWDWHPYPDNWIDIGYGGIEFGLMSSPRDVASVSIGVLVGGGSVDDYRYPLYVHDGFFVVEPEVDLMFNLNRSLRLGFGVGYRFVDDLYLPFMDDSDLEGPVLNVNLSVGRF